MTITPETIAEVQEKPLYYAKDGFVWKRPVETKIDGATLLTIGFPVCEMHDAVGKDGAPIVAHLMNLGEATQKGAEADLRAQIAKLGDEVARLQASAEPTSSTTPLAVLEAENAKLREALKPFASLPPFYEVAGEDEDNVVYSNGGGAFTVGDVRRAAAALKGDKA